MACKWMGPGYFLPLTTVLFGGISIATAFCNDISSICGVRFLLGIFEAGMMPGIAYYMSRWYRKSELAFRLSLYIVMAPLAGAFGGLLASAILKISNFGSLKNWRMIFAIEGIITVILGLLAFLTLTDRPQTARWLSPSEKALAEARVQSERVGTTQLLDKIDRKKTVRGILNPNTLVTSFIFLLNNITVQGLAFFAPTIVATIYPGKPVIFQQLRTVPPYIVGAVFTVLIPFISWRINRRIIFFVLCPPLTITGYILFLASSNAKVRYGATFLATAGAFSFGALTNAHVSANVVSDTARSSAIGTNVMFGNVGGLIATWSFLPFDKPDYKIGNGLNLASNTTIMIVGVLLLVWMVRDNDRRAKTDVEKQLVGMSEKQIEDLDWRHPGFRWFP
jgi:MFS family permease